MKSEKYKKLMNIQATEETQILLNLKQIKFTSIQLKNFRLDQRDKQLIMFKAKSKTGEFH